MQRRIRKLGFAAGFGMVLALGCGGDGDDDAADVAAEGGDEGGSEADVPGEDAEVWPEDGDDSGGDEGGDDGAEVDTCRGPADAAVAGAWVPDGYCAWTWAAGLATPRGIRAAPNGDLLVVERGAGQVTVLWDDDGDGVSGPLERSVLARASGLNHGLAVHDHRLYASSATTVFRWDFPEGARTDLGEPQTVVQGLPGGGHSTRTLVVDDAGRLYVSIGSLGNVDPDASRSRIVRFDLSTVPPGGFPFAAGELFADGLRNEVGLAFDAAGVLWGVENGVDELNRADLGGDIHQDNPAEEFNRFGEPGRFYGYPYCWSEFLLPDGVGGGPGTQWVHPVFMAGGLHDDAWCRDPSRVVPPALALPAHTAPLGLLFYDGDAFPAEVRGDALVALHGSWNRTVPIGYKVVRVRFDGGPTPLGYESFFEFGGPGDRAAEWPHRPVDLALGPDGVLHLTSDASGVVIAVGHRP